MFEIGLFLLKFDKLDDFSKKQQKGNICELQIEYTLINDALPRFYTDESFMYFSSEPNFWARSSLSLS